MTDTTFKGGKIVPCKISLKHENSQSHTKEEQQTDVKLKSWKEKPQGCIKPCSFDSMHGK
ncbi:hypothetical protein KC19_VG115600 [Ceratodon purpureus]|uniref:Uncharacterized protein n=1 Tax=Ceratodon purpureus TaxID=3225 RepID=A0A8T0HP17_CERPU|nr:hypothetical protein KC19_VG115600 [Ceratodon purpureus]